MSIPTPWSQDIEGWWPPPRLIAPTACNCLHVRETGSSAQCLLLVVRSRDRRKMMNTGHFQKEEVQKPPSDCTFVLLVTNSTLSLKNHWLSLMLAWQFTFFLKSTANYHPCAVDFCWSIIQWFVYLRDREAQACQRGWGQGLHSTCWCSKKSGSGIQSSFLTGWQGPVSFSHHHSSPGLH